MARMTATGTQATASPRMDGRAMQPLHTDDGIPLHVRHWSARAAVQDDGVAPPALGTVLIVHGLGEHIGRYEALAQDLNAAGWHVCGFDHRGHGASGGVRGRLPHAESFLRDLSRVIDQVREVREGVLVLLGHSMGGAIAARFVAQGVADAFNVPSWHRRVDALVLSSPALDLGLKTPQRLALNVLGAMAPDLVMGSRLDAEGVSRDPAVVAAYRKDPLVHDRITPRLIRFMVDAGRDVVQRAPVWSVPTLLLWAGADRLVSPAGSAAFAAQANREWVTAQEMKDFAHEIFNERERQQPLQAMTHWLAERFA